MARPKAVKPPVQTQAEKGAILAKAEPEAKRFGVTMKNGRLKWRKREDILESDYLRSDEGGNPVQMLTEPGRKKDGAIGSAKSPVATARKKARALASNNDALLKVATDTPESPEVLNQVMINLIKEASSMTAERERLEGLGKPTSQVSRNRVGALKAIGDTWLKRQDQNSGASIDLDGAEFKILFKFIMETLQDALKDSSLRPEQVETVFARLSNRMEGDWASEARRRMKSPNS